MCTLIDSRVLSLTFILGFSKIFMWQHTFIIFILFCYTWFIPANSHALCVSLTPVDPKYQSHVTGQYLTPNWHKPIKWKFNIQYWRKILQQMIMLIRLCHSYLNSRHKPMLWSGSEVSENLREYLEAVGNLRSYRKKIRRRYRKIFRNSGYVKTKISHIGLKNSWQV